MYLVTWLLSEQFNLITYRWVKFNWCNVLYRSGQIRDIHHGGHSQISHLEPSWLWYYGHCLFMQSSCGWGRDVVHALSSYDYLSQVQLFRKVGNSCNILWLVAVLVLWLSPTRSCSRQKGYVNTVTLLYVPFSPHNWVIVIEDSKDIS
jgi:hypothetical protein